MGGGFAASAASASSIASSWWPESHATSAGIWLSLSQSRLTHFAAATSAQAAAVLPAAAPAVLSAVSIGFARGLGETMIVLLATGNTPLMEPGIFSGLQSLSAAVAAELPEAAVGGVHYRLLFLAALVLFALTFVFNTIAELFRQRLRYTYEAY